MLEQALAAELLKNKNKYINSGNQRLDAGMATLSTVFKNTEVRNRMMYELLSNHIENYGVKNISKHIQTFNSNNKDQILGAKIDSLYRDGLEGRKGHLIETYKTIGGTSLDLHIFQPGDNSEKHPALVCFHGGGWSEGMPDWFFQSCEAYAKKGWVAVAVEYRLRNRHGTLPPDAIEDGKISHPVFAPERCAIEDRYPQNNRCWKFSRSQPRARAGSHRYPRSEK